MNNIAHSRMSGLGAPNWQGNPPLATRRQLLSTSAGLYDDLKDFNFSTISVSTLTVPQWISTSELYVSTIIGGNGVLSMSTTDFSFVSLSTLQLKGLDIGGLNLSFNLGLGEAVGGFLAGLGAAVGGAFVGIGTGIGLAVEGLETGLFSLMTTRTSNYINNNVFETVNGTTQLQFSTLGVALPGVFTPSVFRTVSSVSANSVPGQELLITTQIQPFTTCVRTVSDPLSLITGNSNINTSSIQSFGEWVPLVSPLDPVARNAFFSSINIANPLSNAPPISINNVGSVNQFNNNVNEITVYSQPVPLSRNFLTPYTAEAVGTTNGVTLLQHNAQLSNSYSFISTSYTPYTSTLSNYTGGVFFLTSSTRQAISTAIPKYTYNGTIIGGMNMAVCEADESGFLSSFTMDLVAQSSNILIQWGLAAQNRNSTIAVGTSKRVSWDNTANTSNFINIPVPQSTVVNQNTNCLFSMATQPGQVLFDTFATNSPNPNNRLGFAFNTNGAIFGSNSVYGNQSNYPYQFNGNTYINGTLEAQTIISLSSFVSTNVVNFFSTTTFDADVASISSLTVESVSSFNIQTDTIDSFVSRSENAFISSLVIDYQLLANLTPGVKAYFQEIIGSNGASITMDIGDFIDVTTSTINLSTTQQLGLTDIFNYPGAITVISGNNTAPLISFGFKAQLSTNTNNQTRIDYNWNKITGTSDGSNFYDLANFTPTDILPWSLSNLSFTTTSTMNVNTISTNSHNGNNIVANTITTSTLSADVILTSTINVQITSAENIAFSTLNGETSDTLLQFFPTPSNFLATTGSPGVWLNLFEFSNVNSNIMNCKTIDVNIGPVAVGGDNAPNTFTEGYIGVIDLALNGGDPLYYKVVAPYTVYGSGFSPAYGNDILFPLRKNIDYNSNTSTFRVSVYGSANNPFFNLAASSSNVYIRGYPY